MTQEQLGIASGLLVIVLTALWPALASMGPFQPVTGPRETSGISEKSGENRGISEDGPASLRESTWSSSTPTEAEAEPRSTEEAQPAKSESGSDPLLSGGPDLTRRS